jgi:hypothetical protein
LFFFASSFYNIYAKKPGNRVLRVIVLNYLKKVALLLLNLMLSKSVRDFNSNSRLLPQRLALPSAREAHGGDVNGRVSGEQGIDLRLHVVVGRNDVEEILDDAKIEIDAEGIGRQCNPTACHAVGEHRTDGFWNGILLLIV